MWIKFRINYPQMCVNCVDNVDNVGDYSEYKGIKVFLVVDKSIKNCEL